jgi:hypothetical protein
VLIQLIVQGLKLKFGSQLFGEEFPWLRGALESGKTTMVIIAFEETRRRLYSEWSITD